MAAMHHRTDQVFIVTAAVVILLLLLHWLPPYTIFGWSPRPVNVLSQLTDTTWRAEKQHEEPARSVGKTRRDSLHPLPYLTDYDPGHSVTRFLAKIDTLRQPISHRPLIRIAFFGDSFVEGDMMIGDLRERLQERFGGNGVGWIDAGNELSSYRLSFKASAKGLTEHMAMKQETYHPSHAGIAMRYYTIDAGKASFSGCGVKEYPHAMHWQRATLYLKTKETVHISSRSGNHIIQREVRASDHLQAVPLPVTAPVDGVQRDSLQPMALSFQLQGNGDIYGVAMESESGLVIDNLCMRGQSGAGLGRLPENILCEFQQLRPYDMIILQYGTNVIKDGTTVDDLNWYRKAMNRTIEHMKKCFPDVPIIIMSAADRGTRKQDDIVTMESVSLLLGIQEELAAHHHVAFYNLFEAMGGRNSMARLYHDHMCAKDLLHLTPSGGKYLADRLYNIMCR